MTSHANEFGQVIGFPLEFTGPWPRPQGITLPGCTCRLKRAAPEHAGCLIAFLMNTPDKTVLICQPALRQSFPSSRHGLCPHALAKTYFLYYV